MNFSYHWLQDHFDDKLPSPQELGDILGLHAFELEGIEKTESGDYLIDWDVLPNRSSDCLCYQGIAAEIAAVLDIPYKQWISPGINSFDADSTLDTADFINLDVSSGDVLRATKRLAVDVTVGPSPAWLVERLEAIGQKSINNVVDITNFVMWETGQPVHAFDYDKLAGDVDNKTINIRAAQTGEKLTDLTGTEHELDESMIVIADSEQALDIAGVKGGLGSGVTEQTTRVLMSACNFSFENIRNTSRKLKLATDASKRFENEVPLSKIDDAMSQFGYLLAELAGARVSDQIVDTNSELVVREPIALSVSTTNSILGTELSRNEIVSILERLRCVVSDGDDEFSVQVPYERLDLSFAGDLIEEVGRIYGYEHLEPHAPQEGFTIPEVNVLHTAMNVVGDRLVSSGFYEVKSRTIVKEGEVSLVNPLTKEATSLRSHLSGYLLEKAERNLAYSDEPRLFEIGKIFTGITDGAVDEVWHWAGVIGKRTIKDKQREDIFLETKGVVQSVCDALSVHGLSWNVTDELGAVAIISAGDEHIGIVGVNWWEINFSKLLEYVDESVLYKKASKYPRIERDVACFVGAEVSVAQVQKLIREVLPEEALTLSLFDVFTKDNKKSLAFRIVFQSDTETLSDEWANAAMEQVYDALKGAGFEIR